MLIKSSIYMKATIDVAEFVKDDQLNEWKLTTDIYSLGYIHACMIASKGFESLGVLINVISENNNLTLINIRNLKTNEK